jgi:hypothetical protein
MAKPGLFPCGLALVAPALVALVAQPSSDVPRDALRFVLPEDATTRSRLERAAGWLERHTVAIQRPEDAEPVPLIVWHDPSLAPADPRVWAAYVITDSLWASRALQPLRPGAAQAMERGIARLGWSGNGLHDVLFHPVARPLHRSADEDFVHGHSLGRVRLDDGRVVDLRVFRQQWDEAFAVGHPALFAEHAVYQALFDHWQGRRDQARERLLGMIRDDRATRPDDHIWWDPQAGLLVDEVTRVEWRELQEGHRPSCRQFAFKLGTLLYALRVLEIEPEVPAAMLQEMTTRLWSSQGDEGGVAHVIEVDREGRVVPGRRDPTGESTAIAILSETVRPAP